MKLYVKNMVCDRCKTAVKTELEKLGFHVLTMDLGVVEISENILGDKKNELNRNLGSIGFEIIDDKKSKAVEKIKNLIRELVHYKDNEIDINLSKYLSQQLLQDYNSLSHLFTEIESVTIEKYFILQKIERVKELLMYDELSLSEIALKLNYSSVAYLSNQFKKVTGTTPRQFKNARKKNRIQLDYL